MRLAPDRCKLARAGTARAGQFSAAASLEIKLEILNSIGQILCTRLSGTSSPDFFPCSTGTTRSSIHQSPHVKENLRENLGVEEREELLTCRAIRFSTTRCDARYKTFPLLECPSVQLTNVPAVQSIEEWAAPRTQTFPFASLRHAVIGIDASYYLNLRLNSPTSIEPLLSATGGYPYTLKAALRSDLEAFQAVDATLIFVFDGLGYKNKELYTSPRSYAASKAHKDGWKEYYNKDNGMEVAAERTLKAFAKACALSMSGTSSFADIELRLSCWESDQILPITAGPAFCVVYGGSIQCGCTSR